jgi:hypothetical protein
MGGVASIGLVLEALVGLARINTLAKTAQALVATSTALEGVSVAAAAPGLALLNPVSLGLLALAGAVGALYLAVQTLGDPNNPLADKLGLKKPSRSVPTPFTVPPADYSKKSPLDLLNEAHQRHTTVPYGHQAPSVYGPPAPVQSSYVPNTPFKLQGQTIKVEAVMDKPLQSEMTIHVKVDGNTPIDKQNATNIGGSLADRLHSAHPHLTSGAPSRTARELPSGVVPR